MVFRFHAYSKGPDRTKWFLHAMNLWLQAFSIGALSQSSVGSLKKYSGVMGLKTIYIERCWCVVGSPERVADLGDRSGITATMELSRVSYQGYHWGANVS